MIRLTETVPLSDPDNSLHMVMHRALDERSASPARPGVRLWVPFPAAWNADGEEEQRDSAIAAAIKQVRQTSY